MTAAAQPKLLDPKPGITHARWVYPIGRYVRSVTSAFQATRYG